MNTNNNILINIFIIIFNIHDKPNIATNIKTIIQYGIISIKT